jgi:hypothetical protein
MSLNLLLNEFYIPPSAQSRKPKKQELLEALQIYQSRKRVEYFVIFIGSVVVVALLVWASITDFMAGSDARTVLLGGMGFSIPASFELMRRVHKQWSEAALIFGLASISTEEEIQELIQKLIG